MPKPAPLPLLLLLLAALLPDAAGAQTPDPDGSSPRAGLAMPLLQERVMALRQDNDRLRQRVRELREELTRLEAELPNQKAQLTTRLDALDRRINERTGDLENTFSLYMRAGTFILILIGLFGFGYVHRILRDVIEGAVNKHLRSERFSQELQGKVETVAQEAQESVVETSKEEARQLTRRLIDEFLSEEKSRIQEVVQEEQEALGQLRESHLKLNSDFSGETEQYLDKIASVASERSLELLTDDELYYALLQANGNEAYPDAERYARELVRRHPTGADFLVALAWVLEHQGRLHEAEGYYKRAFEAEPDRVDTPPYYAVLLEHQGRPGEAEEVLRQTWEHNPDNARAISQYAAFLARYEDRDRAEELFLQALSLNPADLYTRRRYGDFLWDYGRPEEAREQFQAALESHAGEDTIILRLARLDIELGYLDEADEYLADYLARNMESAQARELAGRVQLLKGNFADAETLFRQSLNQDGSSPAKHFYLAHALLAQGRKAEADLAYRRALEESANLEMVERFGIYPLEALQQEQEVPHVEEILAWLWRTVEEWGNDEGAEESE